MERDARGGEMEKMKLWIAQVIDKLHPNVCWCDLVLWAMGYHSWSGIDWTGKCKRLPLFDDDWGGCYCGKFRTEDARCQPNL